MNSTIPTTEPADYSPQREGIGTGSIHARIARVQAAVRNMPKNQTATIKLKNGGEYRYDYITKGALEAECRQLLSSEGVAVYVSEESIEQDSNRCRVTVMITLACDTTSGLDLSGGPPSLVGTSQMVIRRSGYGNADDDKGPAKAGTTAVRLALADLLLQGGDDVAEHDYVEYRPNVQGQALVAGERPASDASLRKIADLVVKHRLDRAMPSIPHAVLRLARSIAQSEIGPGLEVTDAIKLIPQAVASKLIDRLEQIPPGAAVAKTVWDGVAEWEAENGFGAGVEAEDTKLPEVQPLKDADGNDIPF